MPDVIGSSMWVRKRPARIRDPAEWTRNALTRCGRAKSQGRRDANHESPWDFLRTECARFVVTCAWSRAGAMSLLRAGAETR